MARFRKAYRSASAYRGALARARILASQGAAASLKLSMMGLTRQGGWPLRLEKLRRKLKYQLKGATSKEHIRPLSD